MTDIEKLTISPETKAAIDNFIGFIDLIEIGRLFNHKGEEVEFFVKEIKEEGLQGFNITIEPNLTDEQKRKIVRDMIKIWNVKGEPITSL